MGFQKCDNMKKRILGSGLEVSPSPFTPWRTQATAACLLLSLLSSLSVLFCFTKVTAKCKHSGSDLIFAEKTREVYIS